MLFISSYDVFSGKISSSFGYVLSKSLLFETAKILNRYFKQVKITPKIVILGGVDTKMYNNNKIEHEAKNHETLLKPELVASKIIEFITFATTGNAQDFGDTSTEVHSMGATSDSHGGLGGF